jgi:hypothetical protein
MRPTKQLLALLRRRGKAIARVTAVLRTGGSGPAPLLITVTPEHRGR